MKSFKRFICVSALLAFCCLAAFPVRAADEVVLKHYKLDTIEGIITQSGVAVDKDVSSDGNGSLKITATRPRVIQLFETGTLDVEDARLIYQARIRTQDVEGKVFLEMWCHFPGKGEFFSRALDHPVTGTTEWTTEQTPFFLRKGEKPDNVRLNLVINGGGIVWIDDVKLLKAPLN